MKIGLVLMLVESKELRRAPTYLEVRSMALQAEQSGFDSIWLYDHFLYQGTKKHPIVGIWECWTMLSALAEATQRVELGTLVACSQFRNPALLAKMAHTLDEVSGGRLTLGLGAGWNQAEFDAFGFPFDHRLSRFAEALQIIRPLLKEGKVDFSGEYYQARNCVITPRRKRKGGIPLLLAGFGPRMLKLVAQYGDLWNTAYLGSPDTLDEPKNKLEAACREVGRDPSTIQATALVALAYPDLGGKPKFADHHLTGSEQEVAEALHGYEQKGVSHLMFHLIPYNPTALERLAGALRLYRNY